MPVRHTTFGDGLGSSVAGERGQQSPQAAAPLAAAALPASAAPVPSWQAELDSWVNNATTSEEQVQRQKAARKIAVAYETGATVLDLNGYTGSLEGVTFPASLTSLFLTGYTGSLEGVNLPASLSNLSLCGYTGSLEGVNLPASLSNLFLNDYRGSLEGVTFPASLTYLYLNGYRGSLEGVNLPASLTYLYLNDYTGSLEGVTFPASLSNLSLSGYRGSLEGVNLPASLRNLSLSGYRGSLEGVNLPASLSNLFLNGYRGSLEGVNLPASLSNLSVSGYRGSLEGVNLPASLSNLYLNDYTGSLEGVNLPASLRNLYLSGYRGSLVGVTLRSGLVQDIPEAGLIRMGVTITEPTPLAMALPLAGVLSSLLPGGDFVPASYQALLQAPEAPTLSAFLGRMVRNFSSLSSHLRTYVEFANTNADFRRFFFEEVETASRSCADRPLHMFARFSALASVYQANEKKDTAGIVQGVLTMHLLNVLDNYARDVYVTRERAQVSVAAAAAAASSAPVVRANEALEAALYLYLGLKSTLSLTIAIDQMGNREFAESLLTGEGLTPQGHMADAEQRCLRAIATPQLQHAILMQSPWIIAEVEKQKLAIIQAIKDKYSNAISYLLSADRAEELSEEEAGVLRTAVLRALRKPNALFVTEKMFREYLRKLPDIDIKKIIDDLTATKTKKIEAEASLFAADMLNKGNTSYLSLMARAHSATTLQEVMQVSYDTLKHSAALLGAGVADDAVASHGPLLDFYTKRAEALMPTSLTPPEIEAAKSFLREPRWAEFPQIATFRDALLRMLPAGR